MLGSIDWPQTHSPGTCTLTAAGKPRFPYVCTRLAVLVPFSLILVLVLCFVSCCCCCFVFFVGQVLMIFPKDQLFILLIFFSGFLPLNLEMQDAKASGTREEINKWNNTGSRNFCSASEKIIYRMGDISKLFI